MTQGNEFFSGLISLLNKEYAGNEILIADSMQGFEGLGVAWWFWEGGVVLFFVLVCFLGWDVLRVLVGLFIHRVRKVQAVCINGQRLSTTSQK